MGDLIKRLEELSGMMGKHVELIHDASDIKESASLIGQLERELESARNIIYASGVQLGRLDAELAAEKALADQSYAAIDAIERNSNGGFEDDDGERAWLVFHDDMFRAKMAAAAHRKARGL